MLVQYILDTTATVKEAIVAARRVAVLKIHAPLHYMVCDREGACATFEFLDQRLEIHAADRLPIKVLTNHPYAEAVVSSKAYKAFGGRRPTPKDASSQSRFVRAAEMAESFGSNKRSKVLVLASPG